MIKKRVAEGYDLKSFNTAGANPLHFAIDIGKDEIAEFFISIFDDINCRDSEGLTPLHYAVCLENEELTKLLLKAGGDPKLNDFNNESAFDIASPDIQEIITNLTGQKYPNYN